jgi:hypothetical protein
VSGQPGARGVGPHALGIVERQEQFAHGREMQWCTAADGSNNLHARAFAVGALDVDDLVALAYRQVHRLMRQLVELAHRPESRVADIETRFHQIAQLQQAHAKSVVAGLGTVDKAADHQVVEDAMGRRWVQAGALGELFQGNWVGM